MIRLALLYIITTPLVYMFARLFKEISEDENITRPAKNIKSAMLEASKVYIFLDWINMKLGFDKRDM